MLSVCSFTRHGRFNASRPLIAAMSSMRLLVVSVSPPDSSRSFSPIRRSTAQPPGPGLPRHAPSVNISTSGSSVRQELARKLEDHALGTMVGDLLSDFEAFLQGIHHLTHQHFGCRRAGCNPDSVGLS